MKKCNYCLIEKEILDFPKKGCKCKKCVSEGQKKYYLKNSQKIKNKVKEYSIKNADEIKKYKNIYNKNNPNLDYHKKYREDNKKLISDKRKDYYKDNKKKIKKYQQENKEHLYQKKKEHYLKNKERYLSQGKIYIANRKLKDSLYRLQCSIRTLISQSFKTQYTKKSKKTVEILGCSYEEFKKFIENKFDENMNWNNYATYWQLDHIIPISWATNEEEVYKLNYYQNFQPKYWKDNIKKGNKYSG